MNTVKILHCADIHIGAAQSFLGTLAEKRRYEVLMTFERIIDTAKENDVKIIAIAGDLFDSNNIEKSFIDAVFNKIACVPYIKIVAICGNHDPLDSNSPFNSNNLPENLYVLGSEDEAITFEDIKTRVYGRSFGFCYENGREKFSIIPCDNEYINLMLMHGDFKADLKSNYNAISPEFIKSSSMDYIALGHVHKRSGIEKIGDTFFAYCGCPEGQGFDELDQKGVYMGNIGKGICELEFVPINKRQHIHIIIDISDLNNENEIPDKILRSISETFGENYPENLYKIDLTGELPEDFDISLSEIAERLSDKLFFIKLRDYTEVYIDKEALAKEASLKGIFVKNMLKKIEEAQDSEKIILRKALSLGLKAFKGEVSWNED